MRRRRLYPTFMIALLATCVVSLISCQRHAETDGFQPEILLGAGKPNRYLDKKNLEKHNILPDQRTDLLNFLRSLNVDCTLEKPPLPQK